MNLKEAEKILVLDPIHGAEVIAEELKELGKDAEVFNPYREPSFSGDLDYDLVLAPVHLNPNFEVVKRARKAGIPFATHHTAVKEIAALNSKNLFATAGTTAGTNAGTKVVEVTGTVGKTAVCELICQLLKDKAVLSHTSSATRFRPAAAGGEGTGGRGRGREGGEKGEVRFPRIGGTPANVLKVARLAREKGLTPEVAVFEVSLGLTGVGDVGVVTSLNEDYRIAGGTKDASAAKIASLKNYADAGKDKDKPRSVVVLPKNFLTKILSKKSEENGFNENTFGGEGANLWLNEGESKVVFNGLKTANRGSLTVSGEKKFSAFGLGGDYYKNALEAAFCAVLSLGVPPEEVCTENLSAVGGRMKVGKLKGRFLIDNSNSGTKLKFLDEIAEKARRISEKGKMILIVGEESEYVCEGVELEELKGVVEKRAAEFAETIIVGEKFRGKIKVKSERVFFSDRLDAALERAVRDSEPGSVIISNVKTWR